MGTIPGTLHISMPTVDNKVTENLTPEQARKLLQALDEEPNQTLASLVRLALFTGMRRGALLNLQWQDVDFERGFVMLCGEVAKKGKTKTIPMNEQARAILSSVPQTRSPYVFPGRYNGKPRGNIMLFLKRVKRKRDCRNPSALCMACAIPLLPGWPIPGRFPCTSCKSCRHTPVRRWRSAMLTCMVKPCARPPESFPTCLTHWKRRDNVSFPVTVDRMQARKAASPGEFLPDVWLLSACSAQSGKGRCAFLSALRGFGIRELRRWLRGNFFPLLPGRNTLPDTKNILEHGGFSSI